MLWQYSSVMADHQTFGLRENGKVPTYSRNSHGQRSRILCSTSSAAELHGLRVIPLDWGWANSSWTCRQNLGPPTPPQPGLRSASSPEYLLRPGRALSFSLPAPWSMLASSKLSVQFWDQCSYNGDNKWIPSNWSSSQLQWLMEWKIPGDFWCWRSDLKWLGPIFR